MYNENYYLERKKDLEGDFNSLKEKAFNQFIQVANNWNVEAQALQKKFQELTAKEEMAKKETDKKSAEPKKPLDK